MRAFELSFSTSRARACRVRVGAGVLQRLVEELAAEPPGQLLVVVSDSNVGPLHGAPLRDRLRQRALRAELLTFPAGESSKTRETKARLEDRLLELGVTREAALIALGGGVTGDLAGFVAATWNRGIPVIQVPTSLLSMADAALGGKTAVNLQGSKNAIGAFHQPWGVYADVSLLSTLPDRHYRDGFAEIVKSAVIADAGLFEQLENAVAALRSRDAQVLGSTIAACMSIKGGVVQQDEREAGRRAMLNFGHTVAHALETASGYALSHGQAVSIGMTIEAALAVLKTGFLDLERERMRSLLEAFDLPTGMPEGLELDAVLEAARRDKKSRGGRIRCALPERIGRMPPGDRVTVEVEETLLRQVLQ